MERNQWESAAEAILFALGEPVEETRLAQAMGCPGGGGPGLPSLAKAYEAEQAGVRLVRLEESWQLVSAPSGGRPSGACCPGASRTSSRRRPWRPWRWWRIFSR